jgi:hypothetical protein
MVLQRRVRHALSEEAAAQPARIVLQQHRACSGIEERAVMARAILLVAILLRERTKERFRVRSREDGERGEPVGMAAGDAPRHLPTPIVTDQMEALPLVARRSDDLDRVRDQLLEGVVGKLRRIGPRARRIAALVGRHGAIARRRPTPARRRASCGAIRESRAAAGRGHRQPGPRLPP